MAKGLQPLIGRARGVQKQVESARQKAADLLQMVPLVTLMQDPEGTVVKVRELLVENLRPEVMAAFRVAKQNSWRMIAQIPPKIRLPKVPKGMTPEEMAGFGDVYEAWEAGIRKSNVQFIAELEAWSAELKAARMDPKAMEEAVSIDWDRGGRRTGWWQREFVEHAAFLVRKAEAYGERVGFTGAV